MGERKRLNGNTTKDKQLAPHRGRSKKDGGENDQSQWKWALGAIGSWVFDAVVAEDESLNKNMILLERPKSEAVEEPGSKESQGGAT